MPGELEQARLRRRREVNRYHSRMKRERRKREYSNLVSRVKELEAKKAAAQKTALFLEELLWKASFLVNQHTRGCLPSAITYGAAEGRPPSRPVAAFEEPADYAQSRARALTRLEETANMHSRPIPCQVVNEPYVSTATTTTTDHSNALSLPDQLEPTPLQLVFPERTVGQERIILRLQPSLTNSDKARKTAPR